MVRRAAIRLALFASAASVTLAAIGPARAQQVAQDAAGAAPAEAACASQSLGSVCSSSPTIPSGTCLSGCCCHYVSSPEGAQACEACLACSDTSFDDPAFATGPCSDGGGATAPDSGVFAIADAGTAAMPVEVATPAGSGCACSDGGAGGGAAPSIGVLLLGAVLLARSRGRRTPT
jgi:hypothetical protein